jgi:hypothetical protein
MLTAAFAAATLVLALGTGAPLASGVVCGAYTTFCIIDAATPGDPGSGSGSESNSTTSGTASSARICTDHVTGEVVPCHDPALGWFNDADSCYWLLADPQPPGGAAWSWHEPGDGAIYLISCVDSFGVENGWGWLPAPPPWYGENGVTPAQLAQRAVKQLQLTGPAIRTSIPADKFGGVGVPVWLWTAVSPTTWGPTSATASVPGLSVTATAKATQIVWETGDGGRETCRNPGTPHYPGGVTSPTCQHIYEQTSADDLHQAFPITATTTWHVTWTGGGDSGHLTVTRQSTGSVRIGEVQVLVTT